MRDSIEKISSAIVPEPEKLHRLLSEKHGNKTVVFTNGCFDILHRGHVEYLVRAADLADIFVIAINSDQSVRKLKGMSRPINAEMDRALVLAAMQFVDYVTIFSEETPNRILSILQPDIHTKGGDYRPEDLPERSVVESYGGRIVILPFVSGYSTTSILERGKE